MINVKSFTFNPFQENTYVLYHESSPDCWIFDPGCSTVSEEKELIDFINKNGLVPKRLFNTHCHIDHVLGNLMINDRYNLELEGHREEVRILASCDIVSQMYGIPYAGSPPISIFHEDGDIIEWNNSTAEVLLTPGHSPGSICFYCAREGMVIGGDVLFQGSIGRTDLPGGHHATLIHSIRTKLLVLDDDVTVYPGHGPATTIGFEKRNNPFLVE